ncbi:MAG: hypothetical protein JWR15_178 [Prosthecobacter sp.]|nr:hypothetical protein [Prosthecobacter sp.]
MKSALAAVFLAVTLVSCVQPPPPPPPPVTRPYCPPAKKVTKKAPVAAAPANNSNVRVDAFGNKFEDTSPDKLEPVKSRPVVLDR